MTKILIADDNAQNLYLLETVLKSHGYEVHSAKNGIEAMELALKTPPDIIVTDILMPGMDGFELCRRWRAHEMLNEIPFVFYTATYTDLKDEQFALSLGADRFVIKPQQPEMLLQIVQEVLTKPRKARRVSRKKSPGGEAEVLQQYTEVLFRKLEKKVKQLEDVIAKQKKTETDLRESERKYRTLITQSPDGIFVVDLNGNFLAVNRILYESLKYSEKELLSMSIWDIVPEQYVDQHKKRMVDILTGKAPNEAAEYIVGGKDGNQYCVEILSAPYYEGEKLIGFQGIARDITERKQAEEALRQSEVRYRTVLEQMDEAYYEVDLNGNFTFFNDATCRQLGYSREGLMGMNYRVYTSKDDVQRVYEIFNQVYRTGKPNTGFPVSRIRKDGARIFTENSAFPLRNEGGKIIGFRGVVRDTTERKRAEELLRASEEKYRTLVENINDVFYTLDKQGNITYVSPVVERLSKYKASDLIGKPFTSIVYPDDLPDLLQSFNRLTSGQLEPSEFRVVDKDGTIIFVRTSSRPIYENGEIVGITALITDITERKQAEQDLIKSYQKTKKTLDDAINTMAKIVEMRDPYTAGHQHRVAELATAVAKEIGYGDDQIEQLHMAAVIHDIGKIYVPSDILSKPGKLNTVELNLIKTHSQGGFEIVKNMDFPPAVALSVLQHHERLDGSGYPNGLKGEAISREARALAVADVVEAMSSHRPYRPALGTDKALEEISKNKGTLYDADVVDACLKLFQERGFKFE
jgi:PAS domain S-box-containing protein/putative nucleotidyltransferase with HDIG domain